MSFPLAVPETPEMDLNAMFGLEPEVKVGPQLGDDYVPDPEPDDDDLADADDLFEAHQTRLSNTRVMNKLLDPWRDGLDCGYFTGDEEAIETLKAETMPLTTLRAGLEYNIGAMAAMEPYVESLSRERIDRDEVQVIEDAVYFTMAMEERQYNTTRGSHFRRALFNMFQRTGALVGFDTLDPDEESCGLAMSLVDPSTIFPVWGGADGLQRVYQIYEDTPDNIIGTYGRRDAKVRSAITKLARGSGEKKRYRRTDTMKVHGVWNKDWFALFVDGERVTTRRHGYAEVPCTIVLGGFGLPPGMTLGGVEVFDEWTSEPGIHTISDTSEDIARYWEPWYWRNLRSHLIAEAVAGKTLTQFVRESDPAWIYEFDMATRKFNSGEFSFDRRHVNRIPLGNKLGVIQAAPTGDTLTALSAFVTLNAEQGTWDKMRTGEIPPQTPTSAIGTMLDIGGADRSALSDGVALFWRQRAEKRLRLLKHFGPALGKKGARGSLTIPNRDPSGKSPVHTLTPDMLERAGCDLNLELFHWKPDPGLAQYLSTTVSMGATSLQTARRKLRMVPDPDREQTRIEDETLARDPAVAIQQKISQLQDEIDHAIEDQDFKTADALTVAAMQLQYEFEQMVMSGQAAPPQQPGQIGPGMAPQQPPALPPGGNPQPINQQGLSQAQFGVGSGTMGGRPTEPAVAEPATRPVMATAQR